MKSHIKMLKKLDACEEAIVWADKFSSAQKAWDACERGDWMLWFAGNRSGKPGGVKRKKLVLAACKCARLSLKYTTDPRAKKAIVTTEKWAKNDPAVTLQMVKNATAAAYASADAASYAATYASTYAASAAADDAAYAADAADAAADATYAAAAAARRKTLKKCANIVREFYPKVPR